VFSTYSTETTIDSQHLAAIPLMSRRSINHRSQTAPNHVSTDQVDISG